MPDADHMGRADGRSNGSADLHRPGAGYDERIRPGGISGIARSDDPGILSRRVHHVRSEPAPVTIDSARLSTCSHSGLGPGLRRFDIRAGGSG